MYAASYRVADLIARGLAFAGGGILILITLITCVSIAGRAFVPLDIGIGPIRGIYDITEIGMAAAIFAFLPWAQLRETHARVDLFQAALPRRVDLALDLLFNIGMAFVAIVGSWRLYLGMLDKLSYGETTLIAQIPVWQGFAASLVGAVGFVIVSVFCIWRAARRLIGMEQQV
ncbi:Tripartite ATP-independent periplasmic transporter, DctQ component [Sulfitobacter sp. THAF37]|uniref:TRAP transporter small permease n=1 Tax=Sulfitobacter sp. THAF37 TaxID=2587855 RepID=UPI001267B3CA|nr:TRAP transporter small permease [Sulfitobacter sp. THAF37]QFT59352.1 Tripartite ATP-independent periplasmic transporter, DctQ component [Sulfitobacter sp. THAF37]